MMELDATKLEYASTLFKQLGRYQDKYEKVDRIQQHVWGETIECTYQLEGKEYSVGVPVSIILKAHQKDIDRKRQELLELGIVINDNT